MEKIITSLTKYASKGTLVPAEQILTTTLLNFEQHIPKKINDKLFDQIEKCLLSTLGINKGTLSFQASIRIADCLISLYQTSSPPKLWNLFTTVSSHPNPSNIIACGHIINKIGSSSKSMISGVASKLVTMTSSNLLFPATYALKQCYKRDRIDLAKISSKALSLAKKGVSSSSEHIILSSISLLSTLVKQKEIPQKRFLSIAGDILKNSSSSFAVDRACYLIAKVAYQPLRVLEKKSSKKTEENSDFVIGASNEEKEEKDPAKELFSQAFSIMTEYKSHFSPIFCHFLNLIDPQIICKYLSLLFKSVRRIQPSDISHLMSLFGPDTRTELFEMVSSENPPSASQLSLLLSLQSSKHSIQELSALAMQLTTSKKYDEKVLGATFFESLAAVQPEHAMRYLETSMLCLAHPPDSNPNKENDINSFSMIASHILEAIPNRNECANKVANHISVFLQRALKSKDFLSAEYCGAFSLMSPLPDYLIPNDDVNESVNRFMKQYQNSSSLSNFSLSASNSISNSNSNYNVDDELNEDRLKIVGYHITNFFSRHEQQNLAATFFAFIMDHPNVQSKQGMISICYSAPHVMKGTTTLVQIAKAILPHILKCKPHMDFIHDNIKAPMISVNKMIGGSIHKKSTFSTKKNEKISTNFVLEILNAFPGLVNALPESFTRQYIKLLLASSPSSMSNSLFLSLCSNRESVMFLDDFEVFPSIWLKAMKEEKRIIMIQVLSECIAKWANSHDGHLAEIFDLSDNWLDIPKRCFLYAALLSNVSLDNNVIVRMMNELDNFALIASSSTSTESSGSISSFSSIATNNNSAIYALYALSVLLKSYSDQLAEMNIADIQLRIILSFLNSDKALEPYSLEYIASCFSNLLPVLAISTKDQSSTLRKLVSKSSSLNSISSFGSLCSFVSLSPVSSMKALNSKSMESQTVDNLLLTMQAFRQIKVSYGKQIMFQVLRSVFIFAKDIADDKEMVFPSSKGSTLILQTLACGAFSDMLKVRISNVDYFGMIPRVFILLQRSESKLVSDFIISIAADFCFKCLGREFDIIQDIHFENVKSFEDNSDNDLGEDQKENESELNEEDEKKCRSIINSEKTTHRISEWISIIKTIITSNALPLTGKFTIESNDCVKQCALRLTIFLVPLIVRTDPLVSEYLDDIMTSITRAIETNRNMLTNSAYQLLLTVILNFENVHSEGGQRILELYDSQFSIAIRYAFQNDLTYSAPVLIKYIDFKLTDIRSNSDEFKALFAIYIEGLASVKNYNSGVYFTLATHICHIVETHDYLFDLMKSYKELLIVQLCEVISISKALWKSDPQDWEQIFNFRKNFSSSYSDILVSFIWLQSKQEDSVLMPVDNMFSFYVDEISNGSEYWRVSAAFSALTAILTFTKDATGQISSSKINDAMNAAQKAKEVSPKLSSEKIPAFMKSVAALSSTSRRSQNDQNEKVSINWKQMFSFIVSNKFDLQSFSNLINEAQASDIQSEFDTIVKTIKSNYVHSHNNNNDNNINDDQCIALFTLLMDKSDELINIIIEFLSENAESKIFAPIKFKLYRRLLKRCKVLKKSDDGEKNIVETTVEKVLPSLALFAWANFKHGGMDFISQVMIENPPVGIKMLISNDLKILTELALTDAINCEVYIQFANFGYQVFKSLNDPNPDFEITLGKFAFLTIIKWSEDVQKGSNIVQTAVCLINELLESSGRAVRTAFTAIGPQEQRIVIDNIESQIIKLENKKKVQNLMVFSNSTKRRKQEFGDDDGEWQTLDDNDEDSF